MKSNVVIPKPFMPLLDANTRTIIEASGRTSGKSTTNETVMIFKMLQSPENNIWYCRAEKSDIRNSIFASFLATVSMLGLDEHFRSSLNPLEVACKLTGARCYFGAINGKTVDDLNATKGFTPWNRHLAMFVLDEANEVKSSQHVRAAETTANKFLNPNGKIVYAYNPPPVRKHWAHSYFKKELNNGGTLIKTTYNDIRELLKPVTLQEIEDMRINEPKQYAYWYLGEMVSLKGLVLYTFKPERNLVSLDSFRNSVGFGGYVPIYIIYGVDSGIVSDATAVCAWAVMSDATLLKLSTFWASPKAEGEPLPNSLQVEKIRAWYQGFYNQMRSYGVAMPGPYNEFWAFDSAVVTQDLMLEWRNATGFNCQAIGNKNKDRDIKRLQNGYYRGMFKVLDVPENAPSLEEINTFCYDENNEIPDGQSDHTIDADKYATAHYYYGYLNVMG